MCVFVLLLAVAGFVGAACLLVVGLLFLCVVCLLVLWGCVAGFGVYFAFVLAGFCGCVAGGRHVLSAAGCCFPFLLSTSCFLCHPVPFFSCFLAFLFRFHFFLFTAFLIRIRLKHFGRNFSQFQTGAEWRSG